MKNTQSKIKPIKNWEKTWCKDFAQNFRPQEVKITNLTVLFVSQINQDF